MVKTETATAIIYDRYELLNDLVNLEQSKYRFLGRRIYYPVSEWDYNRVMEIFKGKPHEYKLVEVSYGFGFIK